MMLGRGLGPGALILGVAVLGTTLVISVAWGLATWAADRWIAGARISS